MAIDTLPPWLDIRPAQAAQAMAEGARVGAEIAGLNQRAAIEAAQLAQRAQEESDKVALQQQELQMKHELAQQQATRLAQEHEMLNAYRQAQLGLGQARLQSSAQAAQAKREAAAVGMANIYKFADVLKSGGSPMDAWMAAPNTPASSASAMARAFQESQPLDIKDIVTEGGVRAVVGGKKWTLAPKDPAYEAEMSILKQDYTSELARQRTLSDDADIRASQDRANNIAQKIRDLAASRGAVPATGTSTTPSPGAAWTMPWDRGAVPIPPTSVTGTATDISAPTAPPIPAPTAAPEAAWKQIKIRTKEDADRQIANARAAIERAPSKREEILRRLREALAEGGFALKEGD